MIPALLGSGRFPEAMRRLQRMDLRGMLPFLLAGMGGAAMSGRMGNPSQGFDWGSSVNYLKRSLSSLGTDPKEG
ncbi:MAG: hypothetical protein ACHP79_14735, partial [Terriglobales bacterium]